MRKVGIVACSNPLEESFRDRLPILMDQLKKMDFEILMSPHLFAGEMGLSCNGQERAEALMKIYHTPDVEMIFDVSGGDMANELIPYLDFKAIAESKATFWGYSDLSTIINSIVTATGQEAILYQIKNLIWESGEKQSREFSHYVFGQSQELFDFSYDFVQGNEMEGVLVGGNIRCFLKLAGSRYFPDLKDKILFLEARGGEVPQMITFLSQLKMLGAFEQIRGLVLGSFTVMEQKKLKPDIIQLLQSFVGEDMPIIKTSQIGHGHDSKALVIGKFYKFRSNGRIFEEGTKDAGI